MMGIIIWLELHVRRALAEEVGISQPIMLSPNVKERLIELQEEVERIDGLLATILARHLPMEREDRLNATGDQILCGFNCAL